MAWIEGNQITEDEVEWVRSYCRELLKRLKHKTLS
jgi:hypothetical protein